MSSLSPYSQDKPLQLELTKIGKAGDNSILTSQNVAYESSTFHQSRVSVPTSQTQEYEVPEPEVTAPTTVPETEDHTYDFIPGDTP